MGLWPKTVALQRNGTGVQGNGVFSQKKNRVVGLGYVGLPLAIAFARKFAVVGFDVSAHRIATLRAHHDYTGEVSAEDLAASSLVVTDEAAALGDCPVIIVTVPTPVDESRRPDFTPVRKACETLGKVIRPGTVIVFDRPSIPARPRKSARR
jgi:UDP-N-acetyl-D-galactosamine dehydrogenase